MNGRRFTSFDRLETVHGRLARPDRYRQLFTSLTSSQPCIPRGAGLSYCCASAGDGVVSVSSQHFDRVLALDEETGKIVVEPGVTVGTLLRIATDHGFYPPILPGHPRITVGGCIGFDVHGKSGACFRSCLLELTVFHPTWGELRCSPENEAELFDLTVGGFGLTGFITSATLQLIPLAGRRIDRTRLPAANLLNAVELMESAAEDHDYVYSWNDLTRTGDAFGRGFVYAESIRAGDAPQPPSRDYALNPSRRSPIALLNRSTIGLVNRFYGALEGVRGHEVLDLTNGTFPIAGKEFYFHLLGARGFREYQMLMPRAQFGQAAERIAAAIADSGVRCSLGSLKMLDASPGMLRFAGSGVCLALDAPADAAALRLFAALDEIVISLGGIVNVAKDSRLSTGILAQAFPGYSAFRSGIRALDPNSRLDSALRRRLLA